MSSDSFYMQVYNEIAKQEKKKMLQTISDDISYIMKKGRVSLFFKDYKKDPINKLIEYQEKFRFYNN